MFALVVLAGCTRTSSSDQGNGAAPTVASSTGQPAGGSASGNAYPDWAAAIAPAYISSVTSKGRTTNQFYDLYQIETADPCETALAWYKAHVKTTWPDGHSSQASARVGKVVITLQRAVSSEGARTTIGLLKKL